MMRLFFWVIIIAGSPMTNAIEQISLKGLEKNTMIFGGMNLAMALTATFMRKMKSIRRH